MVQTLVEMTEATVIADLFIVQSVQAAQALIELKVQNIVRLITDLRRIQWATMQGVEMLEESLFSDGEQARIESEDELDFEGNLL